jgi:hypothetical protein
LKQFFLQKNKYDGFIFTLVSDTEVTIREVYWSVVSQGYMTVAHVVFCPPKPKYTTDTGILENDWYFDAGGTKRYSIEDARRFYKVLKNDYGFWSGRIEHPHAVIN